MSHKWQINEAELGKMRLSRESKQAVMDMARYSPAGCWPTCNYDQITPELVEKKVILKSDVEFASHARYEVAARFVM